MVGVVRAVIPRRRHLDAPLGEVTCHAPRPYRELQYRAAKLLGKLMVELAVVAPDERARVKCIVEVYQRLRVLKELLHGTLLGLKS